MVRHRPCLLGFGKWCGKLDRIWPKVCPMWPKFDRGWSEIGRTCSDSTNDETMFTGVGAFFVKFGLTRPNQTLLMLFKSDQSLSKCYETWPKSRQTCSNSPQSSPHPGRTWPADSLASPKSGTIPRAPMSSPHLALPPTAGKMPPRRAMGVTKYGSNNACQTTLRQTGHLGNHLMNAPQ